RPKGKLFFDDRTCGGVFWRGCFEGLVGVHDLVDIGGPKPVLVLAGFVSLAGVDKENVFVFTLSPVKDHNAGGDACAKKEVRRKSDDSFKKVLFNKLFPDFSLAASTEQGAMRQDYTHPSNVFIGGFDHVGDEGIVAFTFWRHAPVKTVELVGRGVVRAPLVEGEGGIGD